MRIMMQKWEFLQLFGCVDNGRLLYEDLITCREAAYLNHRLDQILLATLLKQVSLTVSANFQLLLLNRNPPISLLAYDYYTQHEQVGCIILTESYYLYGSLILSNTD